MCAMGVFEHILILFKVPQSCAHESVETTFGSVLKLLCNACSLTDAQRGSDMHQPRISRQRPILQASISVPLTGGVETSSTGEAGEIK